MNEFVSDGSHEVAAASQPRRGFMMRLGRRFRKNGADFRKNGAAFRKNEDGQTVIEFAFVLVPFFALLFSIFENGLLLMCDDALEQVNTSAARQVLIGSVQADNSITTAAQYVDKLICNPVSPNYRTLPTYVDCTKIIADVQTMDASIASNSITNFNQSSDYYTTANTNSFCLGNGSFYVMVRLMYPMPAYFPIITASGLAARAPSNAGLTLLNGTLVHVITSTAIMRTEPFDSTGNVKKPGC